MRIKDVTSAASRRRISLGPSLGVVRREGFRRDLWFSRGASSLLHNYWARLEILRDQEAKLQAGRIPSLPFYLLSFYFGGSQAQSPSFAVMTEEELKRLAAFLSVTPAKLSAAVLCYRLGEGGRAWSLSERGSLLTARQEALYQKWVRGEGRVSFELPHWPVTQSTVFLPNLPGFAGVTLRQIVSWQRARQAHLHFLTSPLQRVAGVRVKVLGEEWVYVVGREEDKAEMFPVEDTLYKGLFPICYEELRRYFYKAGTLPYAGYGFAKDAGLGLGNLDRRRVSIKGGAIREGGWYWLEFEENAPRSLRIRIFNEKRISALGSAILSRHLLDNYPCGSLPLFET